MEAQKSKGRWLHLGRFALLIGGGSPALVIKVKHSYRRIFWRVYRIGPGMTVTKFLEQVLLHSQPRLN